MEIRRWWACRFLALAALAIPAGGCAAQSRPAAAPPPQSSTATVGFDDTELRRGLREYVFADRNMEGLATPTRLSSQVTPTLLREKWRFDAEAGQPVFMVVVRPKEPGRYPAVLLQHHLGGNKDEFSIQSVATLLAMRGFVVGTIDGRHRGERARETGKGLRQAVREALQGAPGHPWLIDTVFDMSRALDVLADRADVDSSRLGVVGASEGGIETWLLAAMEQRVAAAVPIVGVARLDAVLGGGNLDAQVKLLGPALTDLAQEMGEAEVNARVVAEAWQRLLPGFTERFDCPVVLPLIAPRPLLVISHENDELFPIAGVRESYAAARARYEALGVGERLELHVTPGLGHEDVDPGEIPRMIAWMTRWLKPADPVAPASAS